MSLNALCSSVTLFALLLGAPALAAPVSVGGDDEVQVVGPGPSLVDVFHPDNAAGASGKRPAAPTPLYGGRVIVHLASMPESLNYVVENSAVTRRMLYEVHEFLLLQDWEYHDYKPMLATGYEMEDMLALVPEAAKKYGDAVVEARVQVYSEKADEGDDADAEPEMRDALVVYGEVTDAGDHWMVKPVSKSSDLKETIKVPKADAWQLDRGSVFTFYLRKDAIWHPAEGIEGHKLDANDVKFSWSTYSNPEVDCDEKRFQFEKLTRCDVIDDHTVRFFYQQQYAFALDSIGTSLTILPSHIYNLADPDCPWHDPEASPSKQAKHINENPHNSMWVGLGPYRITEASQQWFQAERFDDYFDKSNAGYVDTIRWRYIDDDSTAFQALLNGEIDFFDRVKSTDYFGSATEQKQFTDKFYKGYFYLGTFGYTGWNMYRPHLADKAVRQAIAHAFDFEDYKATNYKNLCNQVTGAFPFNSRAYNHDVKPYPYDPDRAIELLEDAGWYDRTGDGIVDKDGKELEIEFLMPSGNDASKNFGLKLQESLGEIGIRLKIAQLEWATFLDRFKNRDFDAANLAWIQPLESDPEQLWHSKWGKYEARSSNNSGVMDPYIDDLIRQGQREVDFDERQKVWHKMHSYLYDMQPYMFMYNVPRKFALTKRIRGFQSVAIDPGYILRRWHFVDPEEPGTRKTLERQ